MSKSALYAGLGRGLMALGNHVGDAYRMKAIEEMRQENLERNWARQDAIREEDRAYQKELTADNRAYQQAQTADDRAWQMEQNEQKFTQQQGLLQDKQQYESNNQGVETTYEEVDGKHFKVSKNANGEVVNRTELRSDGKLPPMTKLRVDSLTDEINGIVKSGKLGMGDKIDKRYELLIKQRNDILGLKEAEPSGDGNAPPEAIAELRANPTEEMKAFFKETFGYLPAGI